MEFKIVYEHKNIMKLYMKKTDEQIKKGIAEDIYYAIRGEAEVAPKWRIDSLALAIETKFNEWTYITSEEIREYEYKGWFGKKKLRRSSEIKRIKEKFDKIIESYVELEEEIELIEK